MKLAEPDLPSLSGLSPPVVAQPGFAQSGFAQLSAMRISATRLAPPWLLELRGAGKSYANGGDAPVRALRGVDLRVAAGEFIAVMGGTGAGKSTALNLLACAEEPSEGVSLFRGVRTDNLSHNSRAMLRRGFFGFASLSCVPLARGSARDYVEQALLDHVAGLAMRQVAAEEALAAVGLEGWEERRPASLSREQQQRLAVARAIATQPAVLIADGAGGFQATPGPIVDLLEQLNSEGGLTVLMVTNDPQAAARARRVLRFAEGRLISDTRAVPQETDCLP